MVRTQSTMLPLGTRAPDFALADVDGRNVRLADFDGAPALLVAFLSNHCPFVKHVQAGFVSLARDYQTRGVAVVAIASNDLESHPEDGPGPMAAEARAAGYTFPYLFDATQDVATSFRAACTPDFYVFDGKRKLVYRGQLDASRPGTSIPVTGADLRAALDAVLAGRSPSEEQRPSMGCNIKWRAGREPDYFPR